MTRLVRRLLRLNSLSLLSSAGFGALCALLVLVLLVLVLGAQPLDSPALYVLLALVGFAGGYVHHRVMLWLLFRGGGF
jgi:hypothetical protein